MPPPMFGFAWIDEGTAWSTALFREDEDIFSVEISHAEGDFAEMHIDVRNTGSVGLLAVGRKQWAWFSWKKPGAGAATPLFYGRVVGTPDDTHLEIVKLSFIARPTDYYTVRAALAATMRVAPYWDPVWLQDKLTSDDTVLETYSKRWHINRITHAVSASDISVGEDGTIEFTTDKSTYASVRVTLGDTPLKRVDVVATVTWDQLGTGTVDITDNVWRAFRDSGSPYEMFPIIASFTSLGLFNDWPEPNSNLGGGWKVAEDAFVEMATWLPTGVKKLHYSTLSVDEETPHESDEQTNPLLAGDLIDQERVNWNVAFPIYPIKPTMRVTYEADRKRAEILTFSLEADTQAIITDPDGEDVVKIEVSSDYVSQAVDEGGALPIGNAIMNQYFPTDRGQISVVYLLLMARAQLVRRARCFTVTFFAEWADIADIISCRMNAILHDPRLPGGQAGGKVVQYQLSMDSTGKMEGEVTIGCSVGYGVALPDALEPEDDYAEDYADDWTQQEPGGEIAPIPGELMYESFDGVFVVDDDNVDFANMTPQRIIQSLTVTNGLNAQEAIITSGARDGDPIGFLREAPTLVTLALVPVTGGAFITEYPITVSKLVIAQTVNLEAAA